MLIHLRIMKNKLILALLPILLISCTSTKYTALPTYNNINTYQYGSFIGIYRKASYVAGELIAIDTNKIIILNKKKEECITVPIEDVRRFLLRYARPKHHYGWSIAVFNLATLSHGAFSLLTLPINLAVTISVTATAEHQFSYNRNDMTFDKLKMFARFPQGIPPNVTLASIK
jgi:hypothetical protein